MGERIVELDKNGSGDGYGYGSGDGDGYGYGFGAGYGYGDATEKKTKPASKRTKPEIHMNFLKTRRTK